MWCVTQKIWTMAPQPTRKRLGVGASCTIKLRFLHPKNHIQDKIPNQTASQQLTGLIVQSKAEKVIHKVNKECIVFQHEDLGRQLIWALQRYVQVDIQGPEESFFEEETQEPPTAESLPSTEDSPGTNNNNMGLWTHNGICERKQQPNAMPSPNLLSGCHHCPTHQTSTCLKGCFSPHSSKQQSFPKPTKTFPMAKNQSYMGNFYIGLVCGC